MDKCRLCEKLEEYCGFCKSYNQPHFDKLCSSISQDVNNNHQNIKYIIATSGWRYSGKTTFSEFIQKSAQSHSINSRVFHFAQYLKDEAMDKYDLTKEQVYTSLKEQILYERPVECFDKFTSVAIIPILDECKCGETLDIVPNVMVKISDKYWKDESTCRIYKSLNTDTYSSLYWTPRAILIYVGSTSRAIDPFIWVKKTFKDIINFFDGKEGLFNGGFMNNRIAMIGDLRYKNEIKYLKEKVEQITEKDYQIKLITIRINRFECSSSNDPSERDLDSYEFDTIIDNSEGSPLFHLESSAEKLISCLM